MIKLFLVTVPDHFLCLDNKAIKLFISSNLNTKDTVGSKPFQVTDMLARSACDFLDD